MKTGKVGRRGSLVLGIVLGTLGMAGLVRAEEQASYVDGALGKLGRGVANVVTSPLELIRTPELVSRTDGYMSAMSVGLLQGTWHAIRRAGVGLFEVATFYAEIPKGFKPIISPEFVWAHGNWAE